MENDNKSSDDKTDGRSGLMKALSRSSFSGSLTGTSDHKTDNQRSGLMALSRSSFSGSLTGTSDHKTDRRSGLLKAVSKSSLSLFENTGHKEEKRRRGLRKEVTLSYFDSSDHLNQTRRVLQRNASKSSLFDDTASQGVSVDTFWVEGEWDDVQNPVLRACVKVLVFLLCLPEARVDSTPLKLALRWLQWASMLADLAAGIVALVTFNGVTYCCGQPILNFGSLDLNWHLIIRILTYLYLILICTEIYPVVKKGIPFNLVNPLLGFIVGVAMFFDDSKQEALMMWSIETFAVTCEYGILQVKTRQRDQLEKDIKRAAKLTSREREEKIMGTCLDRDEADAEISRNRREYYRLKLEQSLEKKLVWYLRVGSWINISLVLIFLSLIVVISYAGGLCVNGGSAPNPFNLNQLAGCPACTDINELCEVCSDTTQQCYFPYA